MCIRDRPPTGPSVNKLPCEALRGASPGGGCRHPRTPPTGTSGAATSPGGLPPPVEAARARGA
eukprot:13143701-Alexandrium_andersonii.AAC.1